MSPRVEGARSLRWPDPTVAWVLLMLATITTTWVFSTRSLSATAGAVATFVLVAWKVRLVVLDFMELREAPWPLRFAFEGWALAVPAMVLSFYLTR